MLIYWFLPMILFLGIVTSYEDIKFGKIRNKWVLMAIVYSIIVNSILFSLNYYDFSYLIKFVVNASLSLIIGFLIWHLNLWTSGDAKLFFAFVLLIPISKFNGYFYFTNLLISSFVPISIFFLFYALIRTNNNKLIYFKKTFNFKTIIKLIFFIFAFSWVIGLGFKIFKLQNNLFLALFITFLIYYYTKRIFRMKVIYISLFLSVIRLIFDKSVYSFQFVSIFSILILIFLLIRIFLFVISSDYFTKEVKINNLKEGMEPAEIIIRIKNKYIKKPKIFSFIKSTKRERVGELLFENSVKGLSEKEIDRLKSLQKQLPFKTLKIETTIPFAPFIFIGSLLTILINGNLVGIIRLILPKFININFI